MAIVIKSENLPPSDRLLVEHNRQTRLESLQRDSQPTNWWRCFPKLSAVCSARMAMPAEMPNGNAKLTTVRGGCRLLPRAH